MIRLIILVIHTHHFALIRYVLLVGYVFHFDSLLEVPQLL
jgi:hypothetical protein